MEDKTLKECPLKAAINRRKFLKNVGKSAVIAVAVPTLGPLTGCDDGNSNGGCGGDIPQGCDSLETVRISKPAAPPSGTATVGIAKKESISEAVEKAIELAGGLSDIKPGDKVIIKPNIVAVGWDVRPYTHPEVMRAVIQQIKQQTDAENITVGEASYAGPGSNGTTANAQGSGILEVINQEGVKFLAWDEDPDVEYVEILCDDMEYVGYNIHIPKALVDGTYQHFINVPMIKNHTWQNAGYTCCIKSFVGTLNPSNRNADWATGTHEWLDLSKAVAELNLSTPKITMNIVDALSPVMVNGPLYPSGMKTHDAGLIIASCDRVAADTMALAVLRHYASLDSTIDEPYQQISVWEQPQVTRAIELNLGRSAENVTYAHEGVDEIEEIIARWS